MKASNRELKVTAYHEAGHAVMAYVLGKPIEYVQIASVEGRPPGVNYLPESPIDTDTLDSEARELVLREIKIALGGIVAQNHLTAHPENIVGGWGDWSKARQWAADLVGEEQAFAFTRQVRAEVEGFIGNPRNWSAVRDLANQLTRHHRLDGKRVFEIVSSALTEGESR